MVSKSGNNRNSDSANLPAFPMDRADPLSLPPGYDESMHEGKPKKVKLYDGTTAWIATRYDDVRAILREDSRFSANPRLPGYPFLSETRSFIAQEPPMLMNLDGEEHAALRRVLTREFTHKGVNTLRPQLEQIVDRAIDNMIASGKPADLVEHVALPIPSTVIAEILGVPYEDHAFFQEQAMLRLSTDGDDVNIPLIASKKMDEYFEGLFEQRLSSSCDGTDITSHLARDYVSQGKLSREQAIRLCSLLLLAGHETTGNMIAMSTLTLLRNRDQLQLLLQNPDLLNNAVEELLRYLSVVHFHTPRAVTRDMEIGGETIRAGEGIYALLNAANHDERVFSCPHKFDITRKTAGHIAFSYGVHQCLGQPLARLELQIMFSKLFQRLPGLDLAVPFDELRFKNTSMVYGLHSLPVTW